MKIKSHVAQQLFYSMYTSDETLELSTWAIFMNELFI